ncbi:taste receptor type 2 member 50-like [Marmota monax]|uniref:taste receptor type 2 member 50-like n=1 Tax=Marmota monax TaxID=9995 RepID=UPI001EAFD4B6|nr:taste receptor type 2 member 50-like [Marmota monax]
MHHVFELQNRFANVTRMLISSGLMIPWTQLRIIFLIAWAAINHFSTWLASSLSIFYLLKIAFLQPIFIHLRRREKSAILVSWVLSTKVYMNALQALVSILLLFAMSSPSLIVSVGLLIEC